MKSLTALTLSALLVIGVVSASPSQANTEAPVSEPTQATSQAHVQAPDAPLTYPSSEVSTTPAPVEAPAPEAPAPAPVEAPYEAPVEAPAEVVVEQPTAAPTPTTEAPVAPAEAPTEAPAPVDPRQGMTTVDGTPCMEDDPCFNCLTMGNFFCGTSEAFALYVSQFAPEGTPEEQQAAFTANYLGVYPTNGGNNVGVEGLVTVTSVINPTYEFHFKN